MGTSGEVLIEWSDHQRHLRDGIWNHFRENYKSDLTLSCNEFVTRAHQLVIAIFCTSLKEVFPSSNVSEVKWNLDSVTACGADISVLVEFMYRGRVSVANDRLDQITKLAGAMGVQGFVSCVEDLRRKNDKISSEVEDDDNKKNDKAVMDSDNGSSDNNQPRIKRAKLHLEHESTYELSDDKEDDYDDDDDDDHVDDYYDYFNTSSSDDNDDGDVVDEDGEDDVEDSHDDEEDKPLFSKRKRSRLGTSVGNPILVFEGDEASGTGGYTSKKPQPGLDISSDGTVKYRCEVCHKLFRNKTGYQYHYAQFHGDPALLEKCGHCDYVTPKKVNLDNHLAAIHKVDYDGNQLTDTLNCSICAFTCFSKYTFRSHMVRKHSSDKRHKCPDCDYRSVQKHDVEVHRRLKHSEDRPYMCDTCGSAFKTLGHLNGHLRTHTGEKPFSCDLCEQRFTRQSGLNKHQLLHTGSKPFACPLCRYACRRKYHLTLHLQRVHKTEVTAEEPQLAKIGEVEESDVEQDVVTTEVFENSLEHMQAAETIVLFTASEEIL